MKKREQIHDYILHAFSVRFMFLSLLFIFTYADSTQAQTLLNGSFETHTALTDQINLTNAAFNLMVGNTVGFGSYGDLDLITTSTYCGGPPNGNWYVGLTGSGTDAFSMKLSTPITAGASYTLKFADHGCGAPYSIGPCAVQVGVSTLNNVFGTIVYTAPLPISGVWTQRTAVFVAPVSAQYITVQLTGGALSNWTQVDNFIITQAPLPVELLSFTGTFLNDDVLLNWATASETNNDHFEIERSTDGETFKQIGTVNGSGTTSIKQEYSFADKQAPQYLLYYRLKQIDFDGAYQISKTIALAHKTSNRILIYCNNSSEGMVDVHISGAQENDEISISIIDINGKSFHSSKFLFESDQKISIPYPSPGTYFIRLLTGTDVVQKKFVALR